MNNDYVMKLSDDELFQLIKKQFGITVKDKNDIKGAWEVVEKLQAKPLEYYIEISRIPAIHFLDTKKSHWHVVLGDAFAHGDTAPLAICRAGLLAAMGD